MVVPLKVLVELEGTVRKVVKQDLVSDEKFILDGAVEPLGMGVHFWSSGIRAPVDEMKLTELFIEVPEKLTAVVGEDVLHLVGKECEAPFKELRRRLGGMRGRDVCECPPRVEVDERNDVDPSSPEVKLDGV